MASDPLIVLIERAQTFINKQFKVKDSSRVHRCTQIKTYLHKDHFKHNGSANAKNMFAALGYAVVIGNGDEEHDIRDVVETTQTVEVVLNSAYTAEIHPDRVVVGCQTFPKDKIKEIYDKMMSLN